MIVNTKPHCNTAGNAGGIAKVRTSSMLSTIVFFSVPVLIMLGRVENTAMIAIIVEQAINL